MSKAVSKEAPVLLICMGVSGCGKSTVAKSLTDQFDLEFIEADEFHSDINRAHMAAGNALDESMRRPWIDNICKALSDYLQDNRNCTLACSCLRRAHRQRFREAGFRTHFIHLCGDKEVIAARMMKRQGHFMPTGLLDSQYSDLEATDDEADIVSLDIKPDLPQVLSQAAALARTFIQSSPVSRYIYGTTRLGDESVSLEQQISIAHLAMESGVWFHASDQYGSALSVLAQAFKEAPDRIPKMIFKVEAETIGEMRSTIQRNLEPIGVGHMDIGQLCLRDRSAEDFLPGSEGYEEFSKIRNEGLVNRYFMEVFPWTSPVALEALDKGCTDDLIDGLIFYFNPLQRFATNNLWQKIQKMNIPIVAMRTVCGNNVLTLRDVPGAAWTDYIQQRAVEVAPLFLRSGIQSWAEFCTRYVYSFDRVQATVGATSREENFAELLQLSESAEPFPADIKEELLTLQARWSDELDQSAEAWTL